MTRPLPKVLIVDDRPDNLLVLEAILEPLPCELVRADSGQEALRRLLHEEVAVILLDVQMPGLDGYETARAVKGRERTRSIPIIFLTAIDREIDHKLRGYDAGAVDFLSKPLDPAVLVAKVTVFLDLHEQRALVEEQAAELSHRLGERDAAQAALSRLSAELQRSNADLERFAVALSHDLREPLQVGAGLLDLLAVRYGASLGPEGLEVLDEAREGLRVLGHLVADVLTRTRPVTGAGEHRPVVLDAVLAEARVQLAAELDAADPTLTADPLPVVQGDAWSLQQTFVHVLQSALRRADGPATIHIGVTRRDGDWVITTTDDGPPIDPGDLPGLFSLFGRPGDPAAGDTGLAIARRTVEQHGGGIWVDPAPGRGTAISFSLPADAAPAGDPVP
ncbi:MAG: response regulator [Acidimicrobiales bacterium]